MVLLELNNVSCHFGAVQAVKSISFSVQEGEFVTLLGPSGCGKTTTLRLIAGFEAPDGGSIRLRNVPLADKSSFVQPKDRRIGMVFQDYALFPHLNVAQNVAFGLQSEKREKAMRVTEMLDLVGLRGFDARMPHELSGGEQQRVALARALAPAPDIVLLDEPFSNLDAALRAQLRAEMKSILRQAGTTCIFVTHAQDEALSLSDRVAVMFAGSIAQMAPPETIYESPETTDIAGFVGEANFIAGDAHNNYANSVIGHVPLREPTSGTVKLLIRPEAIIQLSGEDESGCEAQIQWSEYYGHDRRIGLALPDGTTLIARFNASEPIPIGETIRIAIRQPVKAYA